MSEFTTIQITKEVKSKLDLVKGHNNLSYNKIIEKLLQQSGGVVVEDVIEIQREQTAFSLKYWNDFTSMVRDVNYTELASAKKGDVFKVVDEPSGNNWVNSIAKVLTKDGVDVILLVEEISHRNGKQSSIKSIVHVQLF